ncbi:hypothetical protein ECG_01433 [Echinococcus granulosus]|uniref:Uncharacterized protein n=1 Tax=Echinococcus granulosus TaxID=6210 RepID=A0A068W7G7_ECHGR|nr:hypothetical protein ECG_01433 [Echinococcus granulosus]CDS15643.1 hypothetical protein EgrG_002017000 [Echinococcus granulosus]
MHEVAPRRVTRQGPPSLCRPGGAYCKLQQSAAVQVSTIDTLSIPHCPAGSSREVSLPPMFHAIHQTPD